ncbi:MAG: hypothetical protein K0Q75_987 [Anaerospora sp.]|nr:hypothetical protein [Anaerospora sp.]
MVRTGRRNAWKFIAHIRINCLQRDKPIIVTVQSLNWRLNGRDRWIRGKLHAIQAGAAI